MAKAPLRIADALGFGGSSKPYVSPYLREVSKIKRGEKLPGTITRAPRPSAATQLAQLLTPNTRFGNELAAKIAPAVEMSPLGILTGLVDARRAYQAGNTANAAGLGILAALGAVPGGKSATMFDTVRDAGMGQVFRRTPEGAYITVMENSKYAPRPNSVTDFVVPEELRGKGVGGKMLDEIFSIYGPETISAAASSIPSVKAFYKRGLRPGGNPNATLDDAIKIMKEDSSVTMIRPKSEGILAYHGSPHSFDRFDLSKIGTGEGAQAYGHGLYFAEAEDVAKNYRNALARPDPGDMVGNAYDLVRILGEKDALENLKGINSKEAIATAKAITSGAYKKYKPPGSMYQVQINANPEDFADWDKPFFEQPKSIQDAIEYAFGPQPTFGRFGSYSMDKPREMHTRLMSEKGVKGIKYLDQGSRVSGEGSRNYVVFDDALIDILKKYGIAIPALAGGGLLATQPQQDGGL